MNVKICGITTLEDGLAAAAAGADSLGFNFYPQSVRYVTPDHAAEMILGLRANGVRLRLVGVFVNESAETIIQMMDVCQLDCAQLAGDEPPAVLDELHQLDRHAFKAVRPPDMAAAYRAVAEYARYPRPPALLMDASVPGLFGGTGHKADWQVAHIVARQIPLMLAGGLTPENLLDALSAVQPWGVDVASGVESQPGRKDAQKMAAFVRIARSYETQVVQHDA
jgi:phosphoribosylanthranilate isomerase